jgi:hypothetical protein
MLLSGVTRQVIECATDMLEKSEKSKLTPEEFASRKLDVEIKARASIPAALFMLRSIGPEVFNKAVDLTPDEKPVLILISKILQSIGNGASKQNDPVTQLFSTFIEKCQLPMQQFFAALLARGDALFPQIRVSMDMDLSALRAGEQAAAMVLANNIIAALPEAIPLIIQSGRKDFSSLPKEVIVATLLKGLLAAQDSMEERSTQSVPQPGRQPQPGSGQLHATLSISSTSAQQNSPSE